MPCLPAEGRSTAARDSSARPFEEEDAPRGGPLTGTPFPETLAPPGGARTNFEAGRGNTADGARTREELPEQQHQIAGVLVHLVGKARYQEPVEEPLRRRHAQRFTIHARALIAFRGEQFATRRIVDRRHGGPAVDLECQ